MPTRVEGLRLCILRDTRWRCDGPYTKRKAPLERPLLRAGECASVRAGARAYIGFGG